MKKIFSLLLFLGLLFGAKSYAQTGQFCGGGNSSINTYRDNVPYVAGNVVIYFGITYQATGSSTGQHPCAGSVLNSSYWTMNIGSAGGGAVSSVFTRTGAFTAQSGDYSVAQVTGAAPLASPALTGTPTAPTAAVNTNTTQIATTAFVLANSGLQAVSSVFTRTGAIVATTGDYTVSQITGAAALASPALTGTPTAPTASNGTNNTQIATTAFVLANGPVASVFTRTGTVSAQSGDYTVSQVTGAAPLASPTFTGTPAGPTATVGTNTTQLATTAFVLANASSSVWSALANPTGNLALSMGSDTSTFTFGATTGTTDLFKFTDGASNTGTGNLVHFTTASGSTENPWAADANGVGWQINDTGQLASVGTGGTATIALAGSTSGTASIVSQATAGTPTLTLPTTTGTFADSASAPLSLSATTGVLTISSIPLSDMATQAANTVLANVTGSTAVPTAATIPAGVQCDTAGTGYSAVTLTTTGSSGASTLSGCTLNIPQYSGGLPSGATNQTLYYSGTNTGAATSAITVLGASTTTAVGINNTNPTPGAFEVSAPLYNGTAYTGTVTLGQALTATTSGSVTISGGAGLDANGGVVLASYANGSNNAEYICYSAATSTTMTIGGGACQTPVTTTGRSYYGSTAASHSNGDQLAMVLRSHYTSLTATPYEVVLGNGANGLDAILPGAASNLGGSNLGAGLLTTGTIYALGGIKWSGQPTNGNGDAIVFSTTGSQYFSGANANAILVTAPGNALDYSIATQSITGNGTLTAITNAQTPAMPNNGSAAASGTGGVLSSHCTIIWNQATSGTVAFGIKASATPGHIWVKEQDSPGAYLAPNYPAAITSTTTTQTSGTDTPTAYGTTYASDLWIAMDPGTSNSLSIQLYASASANTLTIEPGTGCSGWN